MVVLLTMGLGVLAIGLMTLVYGAPIKDFSFGNTLIIAGAVTSCTGILVLGLAMVAREVRRLSRELADVAVSRSVTPDAGFVRPVPDLPRSRPQEPAFIPPQRAENLDEPANPPPVSAEEFSRPEPKTAPENHAPEEVRRAPDFDAQPPVPPNKPKRNLLFVSSTRRDREKDREKERLASAADTNEAAPIREPARGEAYSQLQPPVMPSMSEPRFEATPMTAERSRAEPAAGLSRANAREVAPPTVVKSGMVDGMSYSLFSDGSIEAQLAEGMMRFSSIDDLRRHLGRQ